MTNKPYECPSCKQRNHYPMKSLNLWRCPDCWNGWGKVYRFVVKKESGSDLAKVVDTETQQIIKKYKIFKGDGWSKAEKHCAALNGESYFLYRLRD